MGKTLMCSTPVTGLPAVVPVAGTSAAANAPAQVALAGARAIDLPGSPPRGAPV